MSDAARVHDWRSLAKSHPIAIPVPIEPYERTLDAIDKSIRATVDAHGQPTLLSPFGWGDAVVRDGTVTSVDQRAIAPVSANDPADVLIAVLLRLNLTRHGLFSAPQSVAEPLGVFYVLDAMGKKLLKRQLRLAERQFVDLIRLAILPSHSADPGVWDLNLLQIIGLLENSDVETSLPKVRKELLLLANQIQRTADSRSAVQTRLKMKRAAKRLDGARTRILKMADRGSKAR